jgi:hypothetical protein
MRFSVGIWDSLFGEKVTLEQPDQDGKTMRRQVTKKWLKTMQQEGKIRELRVVRVHVLHPFGNRDLEWVIGQDVDQETVDQFRDSETGDLYAVTHFEEGQPTTSVMKKSFWERARVVMDRAGETGADAALEESGFPLWRPDDFK